MIFFENRLFHHDRLQKFRFKIIIRIHVILCFENRLFRQDHPHKSRLKTFCILQSRLLYLKINILRHIAPGY